MHAVVRYAMRPCSGSREPDDELDDNAKTSGVGRGGQRTGEAAVRMETGTETAGGFDTGGGLAGVIFVKIVVEGDAASTSKPSKPSPPYGDPAIECLSAWNESETGSRVPVDIGNVPPNAQDNQTYG